MGVKEYSNEPAIREGLGSHGPGEVPMQWAMSLKAIRDGETTVVSGELERLLERKTEGFEKTVKRPAGG